MAEINDYWYIVEGKMTFVKIRDDIAEEVIIKLCGREPDSFGGFHNLLDNRHFIFNDLDKINTDKDFNEERWGSIDINGLFRRLERLEDANERLLKQLKERNSDYDIVLQKTLTWRFCMFQHQYDFEPKDTLSFIKEIAEDFDVDDKQIAKIFNECEDPYYYDLDKEEIINGEESEEEE